MVSKSGNENEVMALANIQKIKTLFTRNCRIAVGAPIPEIRGHDMLMSTVYQARKMVNKIDVDFYDISIIIGDKQVTARTTMTVKATGPDSRGDKQVIEAREIEMRWKKIENRWKIAEVQVIRTLR